MKKNAAELAGVARASAPASENPRRLLTVRELSAMTSIPIATLYGLFAPKGDVPIVRLSALGPSAKQKTHGAIRIRLADWDAWVERHLDAPTPAPTRAAAERAGRRAALEALPGWGRYGDASTDRVIPCQDDGSANVRVR